MIRLVRSTTLLRNLGRTPIRCYSNIEEFNKKKTEYKFGANINEVKEINGAREDDPLLNDPRLTVLKTGSPEYKDMLHELHQEYSRNEEKNRTRYEYTERLKAIGLGFTLLVGAIAGHQIFMNYELLKGRLLVDYKYAINSNAADLNDPKMNVKSIDNMVAKLATDLDSGSIVQTKDSTKKSGLYLFGAINGKTLPVRFGFFDDMLISDVQIKGDYLVVLNEKGELYHFNKKTMKEPIKVSLPYKLNKCELSKDFIYGLTNKGELIYIPRTDSAAKFVPADIRSWTGSKYSTFNKIPLSSKVTDFSLGDSHCLILDKEGKLYIASTSEISKDNNFGQLGLPQWSPLTQKSAIPINEAFELSMLNNQVVTSQDGSKSVLPRRFTSIACGKFHNVVSDSDSNVWAWGLNNYGQCAIDANHITNYQPIPREVLSSESLAKSLRVNGIVVKKVFASEASTFATLIDDHNNDMLIALGNGIKGQLGNNQYLQLISKPQLVKPLLNLQEYDEEVGRTNKIGFKNVSVGDNHLYVTLNNGGNRKDVLAWGDNESGQLGNGRRVKTAKPTALPQLVEPEDVAESDKKKLARKLDRIINTQLRLLDNHKLENRTVEQVVYAGDKSSAIYYKAV